MSDEATLNTSLQIKVGAMDYISRPSSFKADVSVSSGPTPGMISAVTTPGTDISLAALTTPGFCRVQNYDTTNFVVLGIWDSGAGKFFSFMDLLAEETFVFRITSAFTASSNLRLVADTATVKVLVEAFEK